VNDYPKPPRVSDCIAQGKLIFQGGFVVEIGAHESEASNLLKLNCKINDKLVCCFLDSRATNLFIILQAAKQLGVKTKLMIDPIMMQSTQSITRPLLNVTLSIKLFCGGVQYFEKFTLCNLDNFDMIIGNTFLDAYEIDILCNIGRLRVHAKCGSKLVNLDANYNFALARMRMNLVALASELESRSFLILMSWRVSQGDLKPQGAKQPLVCILDSFNKFLEVLTNEFPNALPPYKKVDHKI